MRDLKALVEALAESKKWARPGYDGKPSRCIEASVTLGKHKGIEGADVVLQFDADHDRDRKEYSSMLRIVTMEDHGTYKTVSYHLFDKTTARRLGREDVARYSAKTLEAFFDAQIEWLREDPELLANLNLEVNQEVSA